MFSPSVPYKPGKTSGAVPTKLQMDADIPHDSAYDGPKLSSPANKLARAFGGGCSINRLAEHSSSRDDDHSTVSRSSSGCLSVHIMSMSALGNAGRDSSGLITRRVCEIRCHTELVVIRLAHGFVRLERWNKRKSFCFPVLTYINGAIHCE